MTAPAERRRKLRGRRRNQGNREVRLLVPDLRNQSVRAQVAAEVARLSPDDEDEALAWIESISEFDAPDRSGDDEAR